MADRANVLVVEVREQQYDLFAPPLLRAIFEVDRVIEAHSALALLRAISFSAVICHFPLRTMDTGTFISALREQDSASSPARLALICEAGALEEGNTFLEHGADLVLSLEEPEGEREALLCTLLGIQPRRSLRVLVKLAVNLEKGSTDRFVAQSHDISATGFFLVTRKLLPPESRVRFQFALQGDPTPFQGVAEVARIVGGNQPPPHGIGLHILNFDRKNDAARLRDHLQKIGRH